MPQTVKTTSLELCTSSLIGSSSHTNRENFYGKYLILQSRSADMLQSKQETVLAFPEVKEEIELFWLNRSQL